jgi:hypothetical protein
MASGALPPPEIYTLDILLKLCLEHKLESFALMLMRDMTKFGIVGDSRLYSTFALMMAKIGRHGDAAKAIQQLVKPPVPPSTLNYLFAPLLLVPVVHLVDRCPFLHLLSALSKPPSLSSFALLPHLPLSPSVATPSAQISLHVQFALPVVVDLLSFWMHSANPPLDALLRGRLGDFSTLVAEEGVGPHNSQLPERFNTTFIELLDEVEKSS